MICFVSAGEQEYLEEYIGGYPRYEWGYFGDFVCADTPGKAKAMFLKYHKQNWRLHVGFTDLRCTKVSNDDLGYKAGVVENQSGVLSPV